MFFPPARRGEGRPASDCTLSGRPAEPWKGRRRRDASAARPRWRGENGGRRRMDRKISCAMCEFRLSVDIGPGQTLSISPDKSVYKGTCKRANDPDFNYECPYLWGAIELFLEAPASPSDSTRSP